MAAPRAIIVIGASAGGVEALRTVVAALPEAIDAAVLVTLHVGGHKSDLPWLLARAGPLPALHPLDGDEIVAGRIYVAPPDHHMTVEAGRVSLTKGPRENWARPAIDPLFRSAARAYGSGVIGVILTGRLNDGTAGLIEVKALGGTAVVQEPTDATSADMPNSAIANVKVDHVLPAAAIGDLLGRLVSTMASNAPKQDLNQASGDAQEKGMTAEFTHHRPVAVTCPDCGGALRQSELGSLTQFGCHIGHVYTAEVMLAAQFLALERFLEQAMRSLDERAELCRLMSEKPPSQPGQSQEHGLWEAARTEALEQTRPLRDILSRQWIQPPVSAHRGPP